MIIQLMLFVFWLAFFIWLAGSSRFMAQSGIRPKVLRALLLVKILAGTLLTLIYTYHYKDRQNADIYKYFDDARVIHASLHNDPLIYFSLVSGIELQGHSTREAEREMKNWTPLSGPWLRFTQTADYNIFNSNRIITRVNALLMPLSQELIFTHVIFFSFFSLLGLVALYRLVKEKLENRETPAILMIFFLPSVMLWCSGLLKDGFLLALVNLFCWQLFRLRAPIQSRSRFLVIASLFLLGGLMLITKYYVLLAAMPAIAAFIWSCLLTDKRHIPLVYAAVPAILLILLIMQSEMHIRPDLWSVLANKREEALKLAIWAEAQHQVFIDPVEPGILPVLGKVPEAIFNCLFRPFITEARGGFVMLAACENLLVLLLLILFLRKISAFKIFDEKVLFFLSYSLCLAFIIGFTTPVTGGLVRYKTAFMIYLLLALLMAGNFSAGKRLRNLFISDEH
jgi:hypothetical protein